MIASDFMCRGKGATSLPPRASSRRSAVLTGRKHRKHRSTSSPVRISNTSPERRARSPSVSPPRWSPTHERHAIAHAAIAAAAYADVVAPIEHSHHFHSQRHETAYFSVWPPAAPMRLVHATRAAIATPARALPPPPQLHSATELIPIPGLKHKPQQVHPGTAWAGAGASGDGRRLVRRLMADLLAELPISASLAPPCCTAKNSCSVDKSLRPPAPSSSSGARAPERPRSYDSRSVAVQALGNKKTPIEDDLYYSLDEPLADGWVGGVRALRDSHVRLVLRQLRHIERLNRALDRAPRKPAQAPAPASRASFQHTPRLE